MESGTYFFYKRLALRCLWHQVALAGHQSQWFFRHIFHINDPDWCLRWDVAIFNRLLVSYHSCLGLRSPWSHLYLPFITDNGHDMSTAQRRLDFLPHGITYASYLVYSSPTSLSTLSLTYEWRLERLIVVLSSHEIKFARSIYTFKRISISRQRSTSYSESSLVPSTLSTSCYRFKL